VDQTKKLRSQFEKLSKLSEKLTPVLSKMGLTKLTDDQTMLIKKWQNVTREAEQKAISLTDTKDKVKRFWNDFENIEKWVVSASSRIAEKRDIYSDEVNSTAQELQVIYFF